MSFNLQLAHFRNIETPFYYYDLNLLRKTLSTVQAELKNENAHVHYALKANVNERILSEIKQAGLGADCVSGNEVKRAIETGFAPKNVVFAGVGKSDKEIKYALSQDIFSFNVESLEELIVLDQLAGQLGKKANFALRINPNVDAGTHEYITTGTRDNKFGITEEEFAAAIPILKTLNNVHFLGMHFHIGSQITDLSKFKSLIEKINSLQSFLVAEGFDLAHINVGGGLGINYERPDSQPIPDFAAYFALFNQHLALLPGQQLHYELGRSIVGQCGSLISRVLFIKAGKATNFMILDAGMTELIRPALYKAYHHIENLISAESAKTYDVVGPICETSDAFVKGIKLPAGKRGDLVAIRSTGAYGEVMASQYNLREIAPSVFSDDLHH